MSFDLLTQSSIQDVRAIHTFFQQQAPKTPEGVQIRASYLTWYKSHPGLLGTVEALAGLLQGDSELYILRTSKKYRDDYLTAERSSVEVGSEILNHVYNHVAGRFG
jgi:hypothetical protein